MLTKLITRNIGSFVGPKLGQQLVYRIGNWKNFGNISDLSNLSGYMQASTAPYLSLGEKFSQFGFKSMYSGLDEFSRQLLLTLALDCNLGLGAAIVVLTLTLKTLFLYPSLKGQAMAMKMKQMSKQQEDMKQKMKTAQMSGNRNLMKNAQFQFKMALRRNGVSQTSTLYNLMQLPLLLTWFLSLRFVSNLPEVYTSILTDGFWWFTDLSTYDPYFALPILAACVTSWSIIINPSFSRNATSMKMLAPFMKYFKFLPFTSLMITSFFPSSITLYWLLLAFYQLLIIKLMNLTPIQKSLGLIKPISTTAMPSLRFEEAVFIEHKITSGETMAKAKSSPTHLEEGISKKAEALIPQSELSNMKYQKIQVLAHKPSKKSMEMYAGENKKALKK